MAYWLFKSEPSTFSWDDQKALGAKGGQWDGVRNYQARNNMRAMQVGDLGFFYHSQEGLEIVGIVEVCGAAHRDTTTDDERWECVDLRSVADMPKPVTFETIKQTAGLEDMVLVKNSRLSVQPVTDKEWRIVCKLGGLKQAPKPA